MIPKRWQQLRDDLEADYFRRPNERVLHSLQIRIGIDAEESPDEWQGLLERCLGAYEPLKWWNSLPRLHAIEGPMHCFVNADAATLNLFIDACELVQQDPELSYFRTDSLMLILYLIAWDFPSEVSYRINQVAFRPDDTVMDLRPLDTPEAFEAWELGTASLPEGRYFLTLNRDVRKCATCAIDVLFSDMAVEKRATTPTTGASGDSDYFDQERDTLVKEILTQHGIPMTELTELSREMRRNIIMSHWRESEGLTPAKIRDRWCELRWRPPLRPDDKSKAREDTNTYQKRGRTLLNQLETEHR